MNANLPKRLDPERVQALSDADIISLLADIWMDPDVRIELYGSRKFISERIQAFGQRGYLTPRERQGVLRNLYAPSFEIRKRVRRALTARGELVDGEN